MAIPLVPVQVPNGKEFALRAGKAVVRYYDSFPHSDEFVVVQVVDRRDDEPRPCALAVLRRMPRPGEVMEDDVYALLRVSGAGGCILHLDGDLLDVVRTGLDTLVVETRPNY